MACWFQCWKSSSGFIWLVQYVITLVLAIGIDVKIDGSVLEEKSSCLDWLFLLNWIGALTVSPLLKLPPWKLEPQFILWSLFLLRLLFCISLPRGTNGKPLPAIGKFPSAIGKSMIGKTLATSREEITNAMIGNDVLTIYW